jgi:hypothetical protein
MPRSTVCEKLHSTSRYTRGTRSDGLLVLTKSLYSSRKAESPAGDTTSRVLSGGRWLVIPGASSASSARTALSSSSVCAACVTAHLSAGSSPSPALQRLLRTGAAKGQRPWGASKSAVSRGPACTQEIEVSTGVVGEEIHEFAAVPAGHSWKHIQSAMAHNSSVQQQNLRASTGYLGAIGSRAHSKWCQLSAHSPFLLPTCQPIATSPPRLPRPPPQDFPAHRSAPSAARHVELLGS